MITEPTKIAPVSQILIVRKFAYPTKTTAKTIRKRNCKHFKSSDFLEDLSHLDWDSVQDSDDPNEMWNIWSHLFTADAHAPMRDPRIGKEDPLGSLKTYYKNGVLETFSKNSS